MPIGLMGGTFDPIHNGHLITAESIKETFKLDRVYFIPCFLPPHKKRDDIISAKHRYAMVVLATLDKTGFMASPIEIERRKRSYTIDTISQFKHALSSNELLFFITGIDSFITIKSWKQWQDLLNSCHFIINSRPGFTFDILEQNLPTFLKRRIIDLREESNVENILLNIKQNLMEHYSIFLVDTPQVDISATKIREMIKKGENYGEMLPMSVVKYIKKHKLYR